MKLQFFKKIYFLYLIPLFAALVFVLVFTSCSSKNKEETKGTLTEDMITLTGKFYYTGSEIIPSDSCFTITYNEKTIGSRAFEYEAWDNIEPGTAYVRITASEDNRYLTGSVVLSFEILPGNGVKEVSTIEEIEEVLSNNHYASCRIVSSLDIPENVVINIPNGKKLLIYRNEVELKNYGTIKIEDGGELINYGSIYNYGTITNNGTFSNRIKFYNMGQVNGDNAVINSGNIFTNNDVSYKKENQGSYTLRTPLNMDAFEFYELKDGILVYNENNRGIPSYTATGYYDIEKHYPENIIGDGSIHATAKDNNEKYYGSIDINFTVVKGKYNCFNATDFIKAKETGFYCDYTINNSAYDGVTISDNLTILEDEVISFISNQKYASLRFTGKVINYGTIKSDTSNGFVFNDLENYGTVNNTNFLELKGTTLNEGAITGEPDIRAYSSSITNKGEIDSKKLTLLNASTLKNSGDANFSNGAYVYENTSIQNDRGGSLTLFNDSTFREINLKNDGTIINNGKIIALDKVTSFTGEGTFDNSNGTIWAYDGLKNKITENITFRKRLSEENVVLDETEFDYDTYSHRPSFKVNGKVLDTSQYFISYTRMTGTIDKDANKTTINAGKIKTKITMKEGEYEYGGSIELDYTIYKSAFNVSNASQLYSVINNENYYEVNLLANIQLTNSLTIPSGKTVNTNGYTITTSTFSEAKFINEGVLNLDKIGDGTSLENCALIGKNSKYNNDGTIIRNYGTIYNDSIILVEYGCYFTNLGDGKIYNNGDIYSWYYKNIDIEEESTGHYFCRYILNENSIVLEYDFVDYAEGTPLEPTVTLNYKDKNEGSGINIPVDTFDFIYSNNINAGTAIVTVSPKDQFNIYFCNSASKEFTINRIAHNISDDISANNVDDYFDDINYDRFVLTRNINVYVPLTVPSFVTIDMGQYRFVQINESTITLGEEQGDVEVWISTDTLDDLNKDSGWQYIATKITFRNDVGTYGTANSIIYDLSNDNKNVNDFYINEDPYHTKFELDGHNVYANFVLQQTTNDYIDKEIVISIENNNQLSSSSVGYSDQYYSISQGISSLNAHDIKINLYNLNLNSLCITSTNVQTINVKNCNIINTNSNDNNCKDYLGAALYIYGVRNYYRDGQPSCVTKANFENCRFEGYSAVSIHQSGEYTFKDCEFIASGNNYTQYYKSGEGYFRRAGNALTLMIIGNGSLKDDDGLSIDITGGSMTHTANNAHDIEIVDATVVNSTQSTLRVFNYNSASGFRYSNVKTSLAA